MGLLSVYAGTGQAKGIHEQPGQNLELASLHVNDVAKAFARIQKRLMSSKRLKNKIDRKDEISSNLVGIKKLIERTEHQLIYEKENDESELL